MSTLFGLTGGIASGKSSVGRRFASRGVAVIDADRVAREVVRPGTPGLAAVVDAFGPSVLTADGELDRKALAALVFTDPQRRQTLNAITHPLIAAATRQAAAEHAAQGHPLVCYEAALLVENGLADAFRPLVVVAADEASQITRAMARDGAVEHEVRARIAAQMPLATKIAAADVVIRNDGSADDLEARADEALARVCALAHVDPRRYGLPGMT